MKKMFLLIAVAVTTFLNIPAVSAQGWRWGAGSRCPGAGIQASPIAVDHSGNVYEAGYVFPASAINPDSIKCYYGIDSLQGVGMNIVSTDSNGNYRWAIRADRGQPTAIATDASNNVYVFGYFPYSMTLGTDSLHTTGSNAAFCIKLNSDGHEIWMRKIADSSFGSGAAVNASGNVYAAGYFYGATAVIGGTTLHNAALGATVYSNHYDCFLTRLDTNGNFIWATSFGGDSTELIAAIGVTDSGDVFAAGTYFSDSFNIGGTALTLPAGWSTPSFFLAKYSASGDPLWAKSMATGAGDFLNNIAADPWGNVYLTGGYTHNMIFGTDTLPITSSASVRMYLAKYDGSGNSVWARTVSNDTFVQAWAVAPDRAGNVWVAGAAIGDFTTTTATYFFDFDSSGLLTNNVMLQSGGVDQIGLTVDNRGSFYVGGDYNIDSFIIGNDTLRLIDNAHQALFATKYTYAADESGVKVVTAPDAGIALYPNPATGSLTISTNNDHYNAYSIIDITGRQCIYKAMPSRTVVADVNNLQPGTYFVILRGTDHSVTKAFIKR